MRLILILSVALGTANLQFAPTETSLDSMTRAADRAPAQVAATTHTRTTPRQAQRSVGIATEADTTTDPTLVLAVR